jgi:hypothetical protein
MKSRPDQTDRNGFSLVPVVPAAAANHDGRAAIGIAVIGIPVPISISTITIRICDAARQGQQGQGNDADGGAIK